jgi:RNA polymerase sigma-70 factor, ECF subfamily
VRPSDSLAADIPAEADRRLIRSIGAGSADALADLYDRYASLVFGLAKRITGQAEDAEEVVQDVFAQVWRQATRYEGARATVAGWIVMLARTRSIDRVRARGARPDQSAAVDPDVLAPISTSDPDPEQVALSAENVRSVHGALRVLPEAQRSLVDLAYYEGLTHAEIAARTGIPLGTVKTRLRTAMMTLRDALVSTPNG